MCLLGGTTGFLNERQGVLVHKGMVWYSALMSGLMHLEAIFSEKLLTMDDKRFSTRREIFSAGIRPHHKPENLA